MSGYRSAISGRYVTGKHGAASPCTTVHESPRSGGGSGPTTEAPYPTDTSTPRMGESARTLHSMRTDHG